MEPEATCGTGVAEQAILPERLADLTESMATVLEVHQESLDRADPASQPEFDAYEKVAEALRTSARELRTTASRMAASRAVPMGGHDMDVLSSRQAIETFARFVKAEEELLAHLQGRIEEDRGMLAEMRG